MAKRKKKRVFKIKNILIILVVFSILIGLFLYAMRMPIKNIYISGNNLVSDDEILEMSGLDTYPSFLLTNSRKKEKVILKSNYIDSVDIKKKRGNILYIDVVEARILAIDLRGNVILSNGSVLDNNYGYTDVLRLVSDVSEDVIKSFADKFSKVDNNVLREISEIEYSPSLVDGDRFILYMSDGNVVHVTLTKIDKLNKYNDIKDELDGKNGIVYLDSGDYVEIK